MNGVAAALRIPNIGSSHKCFSTFGPHTKRPRGRAES